MALPALAPVSDLATWLQLGIESDDARAQACLATASTLVRARAGENYVDAEGNLVEGIPDGIVQATVMAAARMWENPTSKSDTSSGPFSSGWRGGLELNDAEKRLVDATGTPAAFGGLFTIPTTRAEPYSGDVLVLEDGTTIPCDLPSRPPL